MNSIKENENNIKKFTTDESIKAKKIIYLQINISLIIILSKIKIYFNK